jgi:hypothetical protein
MTGEETPRWWWSARRRAEWSEARKRREASRGWHGGTAGTQAQPWATPDPIDLPQSHLSGTWQPEAPPSARALHERQHDSASFGATRHHGRAPSADGGSSVPDDSASSSGSDSGSSASGGSTD